MGECTRRDWSQTSGDFAEMLGPGARETSSAGKATSLFPPALRPRRTTFPSSLCAAHCSLPRGLRLRRQPTGGAAATPPPPRRNLRGPEAACFLFVRRVDMAAAPAAAGSGAGRGRRSAATVAAWGGWGGRPRPGNILLQLRQGQLTGRGLVRAVQFTETFLTERDKQSKWSGIPQLLLKLHATSHLHSDFAECQNILKVTLKELGGAYSWTLGDTSCLLFFPF
ncbi:PREDICTED: uncharacterized protein LOC108534649, partial [Rhinopithecus bieti]|uniref:uncharacterized protein LOC108534649 n=1 Tax=Rhinopithecus bieti TaxID=61621 RepID=UPI00083C318F